MYIREVGIYKNFKIQFSRIFTLILVETSYPKNTVIIYIKYFNIQFYDDGEIANWNIIPLPLNTQVQISGQSLI